MDGLGARLGASMGARLAKLMSTPLPQIPNSKITGISQHTWFRLHFYPILDCYNVYRITFTLYSMSLEGSLSSLTQ